MTETKPAILVLTETFPLDGNSEAFFIDEIAALSSHREVIFLPQSAKGETYRDFNGPLLAPRSWRLSRELFRAVPFLWRSSVTDLKFLFGDFTGAKFPAFLALIAEVTQVVKRLGKISWAQLRTNEIGTIYAMWGRTEGTCSIAIAHVLGARNTVIRHHNQDLYEERASTGFLPGLRYYSGDESTIKIYLCQAAQKYATIQFRAKNTRVVPLGIQSRIGRRAKTLSDLNFISVSYDSEVKRHEFLAQVFLSLSASGLEFRWVHIGHSPTIAACQSLDEYKFLDYRGSRDNSYVRRELSEGGYAFLTSASTHEGLPFTMLEAVAAGVPSLGTRVGCVESLLGSDAVVPVTKSSSAWVLFIKDALSKRERILAHQQKALGELSAKNLTPKLLRVLDAASPGG